MSKLLDELSQEYFEWCQDKQERLRIAQHENPSAMHISVGPMTLEAFLFDRAYKKALERLKDNPIIPKVAEPSIKELGL